MKTIIAGSRHGVTYEDLLNAIGLISWKITSVISGGAPGVDSLAIQFSQQFNLPLEVYRADWDKYGKSAGMIRNQEMANNGEALLALWDGYSVGTKHMIKVATKAKLPLFIYKLKTKEYNFWENS